MGRGSSGAASSGRGTRAASGGGGDFGRLSDAAEARLGEQFLGGLTPGQFSALQRYLGDDYAYINNILRGKMKLSDIGNATLRESIRSSIENFSAALNRPLGQNMILSRGLSAPGIWAAMRKGNLVGSTITDRGFMSTSASRDVGKRFLEYARSNRVIMRIQAPAKAKGAVIGRMSQVGEKEVVLAPGTSLRVRSARFQTVKDKDTGKKTRVLVVSARVVT